jgi:DNA-binding SARP family transcriptional activator
VPVEFRILGPLAVSAGGRALDLGGQRQQRILAALLLNPNRVVALPDLVAAAWDADPPPTAARLARNLVAALRAVLTRDGGFIDTEGSGYLLRVEPGQLDALVFDELVERRTGPSRCRPAAAGAGPVAAVRPWPAWAVGW